MADSESTVLKKDLVADLISSSATIDTAVPYAVEPEELDSRDGFTDHMICIHEGTRRPNINTDASFPYEYVQQYVVLVYGRTKRMKGSEGEFEAFFDKLCDEVFDWMSSLTIDNRIWDVSNGILRVPNSRDVATSFFLDKEIEISLGQHTYTRFYFETIRKTT